MSSAPSETPLRPRRALDDAWPDEPVPSKGRSRGDQIMGGAHGLSSEQVADSQYQRILAATTTLVGARGLQDVRVADVIELAGVSRKSYYRFFDDKEDGFVDCYDRAVGELVRIVEEASEPFADPRHRSTAGLDALLATLADSPGIARICFVEVLAAGPKALRWRNVAMSELVRALGARDDRFGEMAAIGALGEVLQREVAAGRLAELPGLALDLLQAITGLASARSASPRTAAHAG